MNIVLSLICVLGAQENHLIEYPQHKMFWLRDKKKINFDFTVLSRGLVSY